LKLSKYRQNLAAKVSNLEDMPGKGRKKSPTLCMEASNSSVATCSNVTCPTCSEFVRDATAENEGQEALFCEGTCQCWYHRLCVGVGQARFQKLTESTEPFLCPTCTSENQQKAIEELRGNVQALTTEILELKAAMAGLQKLSNSTAADRPTETGGGGSGETTAKTVGVGKLPWNVVASKGPKKGKGKYPARNANTPHVPKDNGLVLPFLPVNWGLMTHPPLDFHHRIQSQVRKWYCLVFVVYGVQ